MDIGILVYSYTGNTLQVAEKIKEKIISNGDTAEIHQITCKNSEPNSKVPMELDMIPDVTKYDKLIIGAPINAFSVCNALKLYFSKKSINASQVNVFVTQHFKCAMFGGNRGIKQISNFASKQGATVLNSAIIHWSSKNRERQITESTELLSRFL